MQTLVLTALANEACMWLAAMEERIDRLYVDFGNATTDSDYSGRLLERIAAAEAARDALKAHTHGPQRRVLEDACACYCDGASTAHFWNPGDDGCPTHRIAQDGTPFDERQVLGLDDAEDLAA